MQSKIIDVIGTTDGGRVTLTVPKNRLNSLFKLKDELCDVDIKKHRNKRSLNANAYLWVLCSKLAEVLGSTKWEIYKFELRRYSTVFTDETLKPNTFKYLKSREDEENADFRCVDFICNNNGRVDARLYLGSHKFDSKQMSVLLNGIVEDCKEQDIETMPPQELEELIGKWQSK